MHVPWCHQCRKWPSFRPKARGRRAKNPGSLPSTEVTPHGTEIVFCRQCPRKLCAECYLGFTAINADQKKEWVSLESLHQSKRGIP